MNVERVELSNFGSWRELDLALEPGVTLISGANGVGKSTILQAIEFALFGATSDAGRLIRRGTDQAVVIVEISSDVGDLRIRRSVTRSGSGARVGLDAHQRVDGTLMPLTGATVTETQGILDDVLGVSRELLRASAFSMQGDGAAFCEAAPRDRKRIFSTTLGLEFWDALAADAKRDATTAASQADVARARLAELDGASDRDREAAHDAMIAKSRLEDAQAAEAAAEQLVAKLAEQAEAARDARRRVAAAAEAVQRAQADHDRANADRQAADEALDRTQAATANAPSVDDASDEAIETARLLSEAESAHAAAEEAERASSAQYVDAKANLASARRDHQDAADRIERLAARQAAAHDDACPECGQQLVTPEAKAIVDRMCRELAELERVRAETAVVIDLHEQRISQLEADATILDPSAVIAARSAAQAAQTRLAEAETIQSLAGTVDAAVARARAAAQRENETHAALATATDELRSLQAVAPTDDVEHQHASAIAAVEQSRAAHRQAAAELAAAEAAARTAEKDAAEEQAARQRLAEADLEAAIAGILAAGFGPQGVPAMIVDGVLGDLADEANRVLAELASPIRVDLRSQKLLKTSDRLADTLDIVIAMDGMEAAYETLSGGERTRVALALRAALTRLLASKRGARVRMIVVDEAAGLDAAGAEAFVDTLQEFIRAGIFETAIVIAHDERISDRIDRVIRIAKDPGGTSRLVESAAGSPTPQFPSGDPAEHREAVDA